MAAGDYLNQYAEGWTKGDAQIIVGSLADSFQLDDPNAGKIAKLAMTEYLAGMWQMVEGIRGKTSDPLLEITEVVTRKSKGYSRPGFGGRSRLRRYRAAVSSRWAIKECCQRGSVSTPSCPRHSQPLVPNGPLTAGR